MKVILLSLCLSLALATQDTSDLQTQFVKFQKDFNKKYNTREEQSLRFNIFSENLKKIAEHNKGGHSYKLAINQFADLLETEIKSQFLGGYKRTPSPAGSAKKSANVAIRDLPESIDWRDKGIVSAVKDQGACGSCWAFATTELIESYAALATGSLTELSAQQVTSCTPNPLSCGGTGGCMGSIPQLGYAYIQLFGHSAEEDYPYMSGFTWDTEECIYDVKDTQPIVGITGYDTWSNDHEGTMNHLATVGPLAVAVDASAWSFYGSGVFDGCSFDSNIELNHAVQMVGYGTDPVEGDYWIIRNSWGEWWGEDGYIRLKRESEMQCGTDSSPMSGTACVGGPGNDEQHVCGQCGVLFDMSYPLGAHSIK